MGINIRTNIESIRAQRDLSATTDKLRQSYSRLSSGLRIVRAADDAAGLSIAEQLRADGRVAGAAIRNANDGISMIAISDGAMGEISNILVRMGELAEQSANGVYSNAQRSALQLEFAAIGSEVERIANTTEFNGMHLILSGFSTTFQVGLDGGLNSQVSYSGVGANLAALNLATAGSSNLNFSIMAGTEAESVISARSALDAINVAIGSLSRNRGTLGAAESRLNIAIENLQVARENFAAAESRIRDVDVAEEAANLTQENILQQAATAVLAQANQQPALALSLLKG